MSKGEMVPEVMTTLLKRSKTGAMASEASRQLIKERGSAVWQTDKRLILYKLCSRKMEDWIGYSSHVGLERLQDEQEAYEKT